MRLFGSEKMMTIFNALGVPENQEIEHKALSSAIERAQKKIESNNFGIRKNLLEYDQVNNEQREVIYAERRRVLDGDNMRDFILKMVTDCVENAVDLCISDDQSPDEWNMGELSALLLQTIPLKVTLKEEERSKMTKARLKQVLKEAAVKLYEMKEAEFPEEAMREIERVVLLRTVDRKWMDHIDDMDQLRQGIGLQAYGQKNPLVEYKMAAYDMFENMIASIQEETVRLLFHVHPKPQGQPIEREQVAKVTGTNKEASAKTIKHVEKKVYPNDPCPCGSGKKYKQCCGRRA